MTAPIPERHPDRSTRTEEAMSGYGPPRGWRGSNAWSTASPQRTEEPMNETSDAFERATGCPHCEPYHSNPWTKPWAVYLSSARDSDGQPTTLHVEPTDGSHVAESDAEWLRQLIRDAKAWHHVAAATPRTALERAADEQGEREGGGDE